MIPETDLGSRKGIQRLLWNSWGTSFIAQPIPYVCSIIPLLDMNDFAFIYCYFLYHSLLAASLIDFSFILWEVCFVHFHFHLCSPLQSSTLTYDYYKELSLDTLTNVGGTGEVRPEPHLVTLQRPVHSAESGAFFEDSLCGDIKASGRWLCKLASHNLSIPMYHW